MLDDESLPRWLRRLADELDDDGVELPGDAAFQRLVLEELDHCRRTPVFEGRRPTYGAMVLPPGGREAKRAALVGHVDFDVVPLDGDLLTDRSYADGRSSYLVRDLDGGVSLACFDRAMLLEADLVRVQELTGAAIVQRTPVLEVVRLLLDGQVVNWDGRNWQARPSAAALKAELRRHSPELGPLADDLLELAVHWLAPSRVGATIVVHHDQVDPDSLDFSTAARTPPLCIANRRHFAALVAVLRQHDLAVIADPDGSIRKVAVGLRWSEGAERAIDADRGMRHRSAQRYSHDHPDATVVVVSEDGPVTIYRRGEVAVTTWAPLTSVPRRPPKAVTPDQPTATAGG